MIRIGRIQLEILSQAFLDPKLKVDKGTVAIEICGQDPFGQKGFSFLFQDQMSQIQKSFKRLEKRGMIKPLDKMTFEMTDKGLARFKSWFKEARK